MTYKMQVFEAWLIYLFVVAIVWVILTAVTAFSNFNQGVKLFLALLVGAIVILFTTTSVEFVCSDDRFWYCLLMIFAYLVPILIGLWLLLNGGWDTMRGFALDDNGEPKVDRTYVCEGSDCYPVSTEIKGKNGKTTIIHQ